MSKHIQKGIAFILSVIMIMLLVVSCAEKGTTDNSKETSDSVADTEQTETEEITQTENGEESMADETQTENQYPEAGLNPDLVRDGKPKKYFTISFDDGLQQDKKIIEIMQKYGANCATFFINTGLGGLDSSKDIENFLGVPGVTSVRFTMDELKTGIYDGFDIECHGLTHAILTGYENDPDAIKQEVGQDAANIAELTGFQPVGLAWPGGFCNETTARRIEANTSIRFARAISSTYGFELPKSFMQWNPTCSICEKQLIGLAQDFAKAECTEDMLFYVWGHGYELDAYDLYDELDLLMRIMTKSKDVVLVTNAEFYQLFKDDIKLWTR